MARVSVSALVEHINSCMQVEAELHNKGADDGDAARCQDRGPLPAHPWQLGGVHKAKSDAVAVRQARALHY